MTYLPQIFQDFLRSVTVTERMNTKRTPDLEICFEVAETDPSYMGGVNDTTAPGHEVSHMLY